MPRKLNFTDHLMQNLGSIVKHERFLRKKSQEEVALGIGTTRQSLASWERGEAVPGFDMVAKLSLYLGISLDSVIFSTPWKSH